MGVPLIFSLIRSARAVGSYAYSFGLDTVLGGNLEVYGDRTPGIWFYPGNTILVFASAVNGHIGYDTDVYTDAIPINEWTKVDVIQLLQSDGFHYTISIDGIVVNDIINTDPQVFRDVKVRSS